MGRRAQVAMVAAAALSGLHAQSAGTAIPAAEAGGAP